MIRAILADGTVGFPKHAREEMAKDHLTEIDVVNVLRGGAVEPGEWENGSWRYRVRTPRMFVVVAFRSSKRSPWSPHGGRNEVRSLRREHAENAR